MDNQTKVEKMRAQSDTNPLIIQSDCNLENSRSRIERDFNK